MCAIDALGIAAMLDLPTAISAHDPLTGSPISVQVEPSGAATWEPPQAVVLSTPSCCDSPSYQTCCATLNFFENEDSARRYLTDNPQTGGDPIPIPQALYEASTTFGDLLTTLAR
jgi:Alkylmercury lyase